MSDTFSPDYATPPGDTLAETIEAMGLSQTDLAQRMDRPIKTVNEIIQGKAALTADTALELERVLDIPASFWNGLESNYREHLARQKAADRLEVDEAWLGNMPTKAMQKCNWIKPASDKRQQMDELLRFFGCTSLSAWTALWGAPRAAYRKSQKLRSEPVALAAWLRMAEIKGRTQECKNYDQAAFSDALERLKAVTLLPPAKWVAEIRRECNACGVAYVVLKELPGTCVSGAVRQIADGRMLIVQSGRFCEDGHFWFTFYHEARHVLQGTPRSKWMVEEENDPLEKDANEYARNFLVPKSELLAARARHKGKMTLDAAKEVAAKLGIAPGIVAGRLQFDRWWYPSLASRLKQRFTKDELIGEGACSAE